MAVVVALVVAEAVIQEHHQVVQELQDKVTQAVQLMVHHAPLEEAVAVLVKSVNKVEQTVDLLLQVCLMVVTEQVLILLGESQQVLA